MSRNHTILIEPNEKNYEYSFKSKNDLQKFSMQKVLEKYHFKKNSIRCKCDMKKELYLEVRKIGLKLYLAKYPKSEEHSPECIFHSLSKEFMDEETRTYNSAIFQEPIDGENKGSRKSQRESVARSTFYSFSHDVIANANIRAFFISNKNRVYPRNYNFNNFCRAYYLSLKEMKIKGHEDIYEYCKKSNHTKFEHGIIFEDVVGNLECANYNDDELIDIKLNPISFDKSLYEYSTYKKTAAIKFKRLRLAKKLVQNYNNITPIPYFYNAVYVNGVIVRLFIAPIYFDKENFSFVDSAYERNYAKRLFKENSTFLKPISNNEIDSIYPIKIGLPGVLNKIPHILPKADFLIFANRAINIVEVAGYLNDSEYVKHLEKKERYYQKLHDNYSFFTYSIIDGSNGDKIRKNTDNNWTGQEIVSSGKWKETKWNDVPISSIRYYVEKFNGQMFYDASKELYRRELEDGER